MIILSRFLKPAVIMLLCAEKAISIILKAAEKRRARLLGLE